MANDDSKFGLDAGMLAKAELEISDRIEERVWKRQKFIFVVFVAGLTGFGVLGATYGITYVGSEAEKHVSAQIERDTDHLRDRLTSQLAEISLQRAELKAKLDEASKDVEQLSAEATKLKANTADFQRLNTQYAQLVSEANVHSQSLLRLEGQFKTIQSRVSGLSRNVDVSVAAARSTQQTLGALASQPDYSLSSVPVITGAISHIDSSITISGRNFGSKSGHVYLSPMALQTGLTVNSTGILTAGQPESPVEARVEGRVLSWSDDEVRIQVTPKSGMYGFLTLQTESGQTTSWLY